MTTARETLEDIRSRWLAAWPRALEIWSKFTRLQEPHLCLTAKEAASEGLQGSFAMIRLTDQEIVVSLPGVVEARVQDFAVEVLAHEAGHHVLAPANLTDHTRMIARMRWALPTLEAHAPMVGNLYTDLLINDRLQRTAELRIADVYARLSTGGESGAVWQLYLRIYEILWSLQRGGLGASFKDDRLEGDAQLGARLIRSYARDWLRGAGRFAALLLPHLLEDQKSRDKLLVWQDTLQAASGGWPDGITDMDPSEKEDAIHPALDPWLNEIGNEELQEKRSIEISQPKEAPLPPSRGQARQPFEFGEILRAAGVNLTDHDIAIRYYREQALPHLVPFPSREYPEATEPIPEGLESWDFGQPLEALDVFQSLSYCPILVPGITTVQRMWGTERAQAPERIPFDLDLYVDSSGSMPNPQRLVSYLTLAGAIMALSALRAGARVQTTLWSGKNQFMATSGFVRDEDAILRVLTGYYGGGTQFPIHQLRDTYANRPRDARTVHILHISDEGISTMFDKDEKGNSGWDIADITLAQAGGGGTMVLNLAANWETTPGWDGSHQKIAHARDQQGWSVVRISNWEELVEFARQFSRRNYAKK